MAVQDHKLPHIPLLRPGKNQLCPGVDLAGGHHGGQTVKISAQVAYYDFHGTVSLPFLLLFLYLS